MGTDTDNTEEHKDSTVPALRTYRHDLGYTNAQGEQAVAHSVIKTSEEKREQEKEVRRQSKELLKKSQEFRKAARIFNQQKDLGAGAGIASLINKKDKAPSMKKEEFLTDAVQQATEHVQETHRTQTANSVTPSSLNTKDRPEKGNMKSTSFFSRFLRPKKSRPQPATQPIEKKEVTPETQPILREHASSDTRGSFFSRLFRRKKDTGKKKVEPPNQEQLVAPQQPMAHEEVEQQTPKEKLGANKDTPQAQKELRGTQQDLNEPADGVEHTAERSDGVEAVVDAQKESETTPQDLSKPANKAEHVVEKSDGEAVANTLQSPREPEPEINKPTDEREHAIEKLAKEKATDQVPEKPEAIEEIQKKAKTIHQTPSEQRILEAKIVAERATTPNQKETRKIQKHLVEKKRLQDLWGSFEREKALLKERGMQIQDMRSLDDARVVEGKSTPRDFWFVVFTLILLVAGTGVAAYSVFSRVAPGPTTATQTTTQLSDAIHPEKRVFVPVTDSTSPWYTELANQNKLHIITKFVPFVQEESTSAQLSFPDILERFGILIPEPLTRVLGPYYFIGQYRTESEDSYMIILSVNNYANALAGLAAWRNQGLAALTRLFTGTTPTEISQPTTRIIDNKDVVVTTIGGTEFGRYFYNHSILVIAIGDLGVIPLINTRIRSANATL